jgi:hypothetical protein
MILNILPFKKSDNASVAVLLPCSIENIFNIAIVK